MDRIDTLIAKIETIERLSDGALNLANADITLTSTMNNLVHHFIVEWPTKVSREEAEGLADDVRHYLTRPEGLRSPTRESIAAVNPILVPFLTMRYLLRNRHVQIVTGHLGDDWKQFVSDYLKLFDALH